MSKSFFNRFFYFSLLIILLGILALILPHNFVRKFYVYVCGISILLTGMIKLLISDISVLGKKEYSIDILEGIFSIIIGIVFMNFYQYKMVCLILGILYLIFPIYRLIIAPNKINQGIMDCLKFILVGYIFANSTGYKYVLKIYLAISLIAIGLLIMIYRYINLKKGNGVTLDERY